MYPLVELLVCIARKLIDAIEGLLDAISDDTLVQRGLEADLGLPEGALDNAKVKRPELTGIDEYINAVDPDAEKLKVALDSIKAYGAWLDSHELGGAARGPPNASKQPSSSESSQAPSLRGRMS